MRHTNRPSIDQLARDRLDGHNVIDDAVADARDPVALHTEEPLPS